MAVTEDDAHTRTAEEAAPVEQQSSLQKQIADCEAKLMEIAGRVASVRHEINNPLTGVLGQAQLLLREELPPHVRKRIEIIEQLATRIRDIVAQLRDVQRPHRARQTEPTAQTSSDKEEA